MYISGRDVCFFALVSTTLDNLPLNTTIVFDQAITNRGGAYNTTSGIFTASVVGAYVFSWTVLNRDGRFMNAALYHNEKYIAIAKADTRDYSFGASGSNTAVLDLKTGDTVRVEVWKGGLTDISQAVGNGHSTFSGWLISKC